MFYVISFFVPGITATIIFRCIALLYVRFAIQPKWW